jgi:2-polyprenyl-6-methoxyphenol hydroxylase-like FAD-dependent oxidoreductase
MIGAIAAGAPARERVVMSKTNAPPLRKPVLIVGGGPIGLGMAIDLAWHGVESMLVEQGDGSVEHPRTGLIAVRTMELLRRWGLAQRVRDAGFPEDYELSMVFCTSLNGHLLAKEPYPCMRDTPTPPQTPEKKQRCPQSWMQPVLAAGARESGRSDMRYHHRLDGFEQDADGVTCKVADLEANRSFDVRCEYLVACDGATSGVRSSLGIEMPGRLLSYSVNVLFRAPGLVRQHCMGPAERYLFVGTEGTWGNLTVVDGDAIWRLTVLGSEEKLDLANFDASHWIRRALGRDDIAFEVLSVMPWRRAETLAEQYGKGRVLLVGDAVHTTSPTGGMGMNTGMQEVMDLGWKLAATLRGWAGRGLLASYETERKPVAARNLRFSSRNFAAWRDVPDPRPMLDDGAEGDRVRAETGRRLANSTRVEWESLGLQIGHRYDDSPICIADGSPPTPDDYSVYVPTSRPGSRAPHAWLADGRSTLDLFGRGFTLLAFNADDDTSALEAACVRKGVPLAVERIADAHIAALYERRLVLVRPDGHVAWRGDRLRDADRIVDTVRGAA